MFLKKKGKSAEEYNTPLYLKKTVDEFTELIQQKQSELQLLTDKVSDLQNQAVVLEDEILLQSFGLYTPLFQFKNSSKYKDQLDIERKKQSYLIKSNQAIEGSKTWKVNGSIAEGRKMIADIQKLLLRAFNNECDDVVGKVKFSNMEQSIKRIRNSYESVSKLGRVMNLQISQDYYASKIRELRIAFEYAQKKEEEKEEQRLLREQQREDAKVQREIEIERAKLVKEQSHYEAALKLLVQQLETAEGLIKDEIVQKINDANSTLEEIGKAMENIDYREANQRAGYVYIISNIGSFGENVFKIGMTRRLDPNERIYELSDSSVPFNFDIHAMIFSDNAPQLEAALHRHFEENKLNLVNHRREFFRADLNEIKQVISENYSKAVDFIDFPEAEQFRVSQKMRGVIHADKQHGTL